MDLKKRLQSLATLESQYPHILSVYLRCRDGARDLRKENLITLKNRAAEIERVLGDDNKARDFLRQGVDKASLIREQEVKPGVVGLALFLQGKEVIERFEN
jgi:hypothetical protein